MIKTYRIIPAKRAYVPAPPLPRTAYDDRDLLDGWLAAGRGEPFEWHQHASDEFRIGWELRTRTRKPRVPSAAHASQLAGARYPN